MMPKDARSVVPPRVAAPVAPPKRFAKLPVDAEEADMIPGLDAPEDDVLAPGEPKEKGDNAATPLGEVPCRGGEG